MHTCIGKTLFSKRGAFCFRRRISTIRVKGLSRIHGWKHTQSRKIIERIKQIQGKGIDCWYLYSGNDSREKMATITCDSCIDSEQTHGHTHHAINSLDARSVVVLCKELQRSCKMMAHNLHGEYKFWIPFRQ